jgi:hypothetical protein
LEIGPNVEVRINGPFMCCQSESRPTHNLSK